MKIASAFTLLIFGLINLSVIVMRESKLASYDPAFHFPLYPYAQIVGILAPIILIPELGLLSVIFTSGVIIAGILWYVFYAQQRVKRSAAMFQVFERLGQSAAPHLDKELRQILREKGLRKEDEFEESIITGRVVFHKNGESLDDSLRRVSEVLEQQSQIPAEKIFKELSEANRLGETPVGKNIALPHSRLDEARNHRMVVVHSESGVEVEGSEEPVYALFVLIAFITRQNEMIVPHGNTWIGQGDKLTIIGNQNAVEETVKYFRGDGDIADLE